MVDLGTYVDFQIDVVLLHPTEVFTSSGDLQYTHDVINVPQGMSIFLTSWAKAILLLLKDKR